MIWIGDCDRKFLNEGFLNVGGVEWWGVVNGGGMVVVGAIVDGAIGAIGVGTGCDDGDDGGSVL